MRIDGERGGDAGVERALADELQRSQSGQLVATHLAETQALAQRVLRASDPAKTRELLERLNS